MTRKKSGYVKAVDDEVYNYNNITIEILMVIIIKLKIIIIILIITTRQYHTNNNSIKKPKDNGNL